MVRPSDYRKIYVTIDIMGFAKLKNPKKLDRSPQSPTPPPLITIIFFWKPITDMDRTLEMTNNL